MDADAELDRIGSGTAGVALTNVFLNLDSAGNRVDSAAKLHQHAVAHQFDDPAGMGSDLRIDKVAPQCFQTRQCPSFVNPRRRE